MLKKVKINLAQLLFDHLCYTITKSRTKSPCVIHHPRLISEIIRQTKLTDILGSKEKLRVYQTAKFDASVLVHMKLIKKEDMRKPQNPLQMIYETYFWCDGFPTISEHYNDDVIKNFLEIVRQDTGVSMPRSMVVSVPNFDIFKGPKEITRSRRKPQPVEQELVEEASQDQPEDQNDVENVDNSEQIDTGAERLAAEERAKAEAEAAKRALQAKKEKRTKKRNDRPHPSEEDQASVRPAKRTKTRASKPSGKISKSNTSSIPIAQNLPSQPQPPPISQKQTKPTIDMTKPLSMMLPNQTTATTLLSSPSTSPSSSSSSEGTPSDYSTDTAELLRKSFKHLNKPKKKVPLKKVPLKTTPKETINISPEEDILIDTSYLEQENIVIDTSCLDHLTPHLSGDAFTHSNLNSPNHPINKFVNTTFDPPIQEPPTTEPQMTPIQASPVNIAVSEQVKPPTPIHSEPHTPSPEPHIQNSPSQNDDPEPTATEIPTSQPNTPTSPIPSDTQNPESSPASPLNYGPTYKPLTLEEITLPLPLCEQLLKQAINIDDDHIALNLSKIKIIPLKRKRPEPTIPFDPTKPFFNSASEPNLELLDNAISLSLKRFKQMDEEILVFPSDIDVDIREMEYMFSQSLRILGTHLKSKIQGRGIAAVRELFGIAERSRSPRLTFYNHEEEQNRLELLAAIQESIKISSIAAERLVEEEARYANLVIEAEQARIAAEIEHKRLADQEALKLFVDRAVHIAAIETNKIHEN
jgi:hypothetical protein